MPDDRQTLLVKLRQLGAQLETAQDIDPQIAARLQATIEEIASALAANQQPPSEVHGQPVAHSLSQAAIGFEASHPTLAGTIGSVIDALARMGI